MLGGTRTKPSRRTASVRFILCVMLSLTSSSLAFAGSSVAAPRAQVAMVAMPRFDVRSMPGVSGPLGFFDPLGFASGDVSEGKVKFYREVELKHARVAMLAAFGFPLAEQFHPLFGGSIDVPSYVAFQETPLQAFWPLLFFVIGPFELYSVFSLKEPLTIRADYESGDLGFDPLGLKPEDEEEFREMQTKELNNGRLAMIAIAGQVIQELVTQQKLFEDYPPVVDGGLTTIIEGSAPLYE